MRHHRCGEQQDRPDRRVAAGRRRGFFDGIGKVVDFGDGLVERQRLDIRADARNRLMRFAVKRLVVASRRR